MQLRNEHDLLGEFSDEVPGYINNDRIGDVLMDCSLRGILSDNIPICYEALIRKSIFPSDELSLVRMCADEVNKRLRC